VVCAQGLTDELARRAWWAMAEAENARRMLGRPAVAEGRMGPVLAAYLVEHLPFETEPEQMMDTVAMVLQPGLVDEPARHELWKKSGRKSAYYVGFLETCPDDLPVKRLPHPLLDALAPQLGSERAGALEALYTKVLDAPGQAFVATVLEVLKKPPNQEVVTRTLELVARYFAAARPEGPVDLTLEQLEAEADGWLQGLSGSAGMLAAGQVQVGGHLRVLRILSGLSYGAVRPVLRDTTAIGSLMRRKLAPVIDPLNAHLRLLLAH